MVLLYFGAALCLDPMTRTSSWIALRNPIFGKLWVATVVSGICVSAHDTAAIWVMNSLSHSTMLLSVIIGPCLAWLLLVFVGANSVFALNALFLLAVLISIAPWKPKVSKLPLESFFESVISAIRYVRYSHGIRIILIRNAIFSFFIAIIPALLPVVGLKELHLSPSNLGLLFASMGIGSVLAAVLILPWARAHFSPNILTALAALFSSIFYFLLLFF